MCRHCERREAEQPGSSLAELLVDLVKRSVTKEDGAVLMKPARGRNKSGEVLIEGRRYSDGRTGCIIMTEPNRDAEGMSLDVARDSKGAVKVRFRLESGVDAAFVVPSELVTVWTEWMAGRGEIDSTYDQATTKPEPKGKSLEEYQAELDAIFERLKLDHPEAGIADVKGAPSVVLTEDITQEEPTPVTEEVTATA